MVATATYRNPDGSRSSLPASLSIQPRPVAVTFRVRVPDGMPPGDAVYLPGNIDQLGPWDPGKLRMTDKGGGIWEATITVLDGTEIQYKYTRGTWETVEWWGDIIGFINRSITVNGGTDAHDARRRHLDRLGRPLDPGHPQGRPLLARPGGRIHEPGRRQPGSRPRRRHGDLPDRRQTRPAPTSATP